LRDELGVGATNVALDELKKKQKLDDTCYSRDDLKNNKALQKKKPSLIIFLVARS